MSTIPKIRDQSWPSFCDQNFSRKVWNMDIDALLMSSPHHRLKNRSWSGGGEFYKVTFKSSHTMLPLTWVRNNVFWNGAACGCQSLLPLMPLHGTSSVRPSTSSVISSFPSLDQQRESARVPFSEGWNRTRPGNPGADLLQFIAELRDFPAVYGWNAAKQMLKKSNSRAVRKHRGSFFRDWVSGPVEHIPWKIQMQMGFFKSLGSEYLNHVFGWVPFVKDLEKLYIVSQTIDNRLRQIRNQNGKGIRRKTTLENDTTSDSQTKSLPTSPFYGALAAPPNWAPSGGSTWSTTSITQVHIWYSARYRYWIPDVNAGTWIPKARAALYGAIPSPSVLWELTPWSWLVDWFGNVGTVLSNLSPTAVENLTADYAFCMIHTTQAVDATSQGSWTPRFTTSGFINSIPGGSHSLHSRYITETKVRVKGSPYGLGIKFSDLSNRQLGILAALGVTQSSF